MNRGPDSSGADRTTPTRETTMDERKQTILDYVVSEYLEEDDDRVIGEDTPLITGGILEKKYGIQIPDADASPEAFDTVNRIAALVERFKKS
jgi:hypothetical protein